MSRPLFTGAQIAELRVRLGGAGLAQPFGWLPFCIYQALPFGVTTSGQILFAVTVGRAIKIRTWHQAVYVGTTNNGSNYWTLQLVRLDTGAPIKTLDTSGVSADVWNMLSDTAIDIDLSSSVWGLRMYANKTGSPGAFSVYSPAMFVT